MKADAPDLLWDAEEQFVAGTKELRGTGLWERGFKFGHSNWLTGYLRNVPGQLGALVSAYNLNNSDSALQAARDDLPNARLVYLDSGCISILVECLKGKADGSKVREWMQNQDLLKLLAHDLYDHGSHEGVVFMMDLPQYGMLQAADISLEEGMELTIANAEVFFDYAHELPTGWKAVYTVQGRTEAQYLKCLRAYNAIGIVNAVREGDAWLAVGGLRDGKPPALYTIYQAIAEYVGEGDRDIHALGVSRTKELVHMARRGWVTSADSSSSAQEIVYNRGPYQVKGPRPLYLAEALFAANSCRLDAELAQALADADGVEVFDQASL